MTKTKAKKSTTKKTASKAKKPAVAKVAKERVVKSAKTASDRAERKIVEAPAKELTRVRDGEKSGQYIRRLLETNAFTTAEIIEAVQNNFPDSKVGPADVAFHRYNMRKEGAETVVVRISKAGERYALAA